MMRSLWKKMKGELGQSTILLALSIVVLCGVVAMVVDVGMVGVNREQLQTAADAAALAGAYDLPSASAAQTTAIHYAELNGVESGHTSVTTPYNGDSKKIEVVCTETVEYTFARILGYTSKVVSARAVAEKTGMNGGAFGFAVFSGNDSDTLTFNGSGIYIDGSAHANYRIKINGSGQTITGNAEAVSTVTANGSSITVGGTFQGSSVTTHGSGISIGNTVASPAAFLEMPNFSAAIEAQAAAAGTKYTGTQTFNGSNLNLDTPIYVDGNVVINGSHFNGTGFILATGDITFNGSNLKNSSSASICFYSETGDITINGSGSELDGVLYAPNGTITMNGSGQTVNGRVIADKVNFNGSGLQIISGSNDLGFLPSSSVRLIE
ncbi:MAG: hypothetical protein GX417_03905 [Clostridiales bacterium]|nr:hypothetical protein [Clostridiales bacterium]